MLNSNETEGKISGSRSRDSFRATTKLKIEIRKPIRGEIRGGKLIIRNQ